ncbi:hypothetical protein [Streptomyces luteolus]|uniref:GntR C-terminal domain-containing protein n=1 Tax=Streptomyces luteolus TaxID=3043615 RepID=A0ABT6SU32_9ACTN|nr:hypothetical protein [Streptomyces sp. B-S-A12]MDI3419122.1 hypothetical protein [Streptomyces sp. B-S-A12]
MIDDTFLGRGVAAQGEVSRALLDLMEAEAQAPYAWTACVEVLATLAAHAHAAERTLLDRTREHVRPEHRDRLGAAFARSRADHLRDCCGDLRTVHGIMRDHLILSSVEPGPAYAGLPPLVTVEPPW